MRSAQSTPGKPAQLPFPGRRCVGKYAGGGQASSRRDDTEAAVSPGETWPGPVSYLRGRVAVGRPKGVVGGGPKGADAFAEITLVGPRAAGGGPKGADVFVETTLTGPKGAKGDPKGAEACAGSAPFSPNGAAVRTGPLGGPNGAACSG
jgi:hypothetical protein